MSRRHNVRSIALSRKYNQRKALIKGLLNALIEHGHINTTVTRAKVTKGYFDKLAAKAQKKDIHSRRQIAAFLSSPKSANKLVDLIAPSMAGRTGGFTTIKKTNIRRGDASPMATLELCVPLPEPVKEDKKDKKDKKEKAKEAKKIKKESKVKAKKTAKTKATKTTKK